MSNKQDRTGVRTAADLERKYKLNWGESFAEVMGIATDAQNKAETASKGVTELDEKLTPDEIFNRLTNYGQIQGVFKEGDKIYINAEYITALEKLFANDINMTGKFTNEVEAFLEPGEEEIETIRQHLLGINVIPAELQQFYDTTGDGQITTVDMANFRLAQLGEISLADNPLAKKTKLTLTIDLKNPKKFIQYTGQNMWTRDISGYIGIDGVSSVDNHFKNVLYQGYWETGIITVPKTDEYMLFRISMNNQSTPILATRLGDYVRGIGCLSGENGVITTFHFNASVNGNNWNLIGCNSGTPFTDSGLVGHPVVSITGII